MPAHDLTTKLWNTYHAAEHVEAAARRSLADLQLEYFDLYLVHFPIALKSVPCPSAPRPGCALALLCGATDCGAMDCGAMSDGPTNSAVTSQDASLAPRH